MTPTSSPPAPSPTPESTRRGRRRTRRPRRPPSRSPTPPSDQGVGAAERAALALARERVLIERAVERGERRLGWDDAVSYKPFQVALAALGAIALYVFFDKIDGVQTSVDRLRQDSVTKVEFVQFQADARASASAAQTQAAALERRVADVEVRAAEDRRRAEEQRQEWDEIVEESRERAQAWEAREGLRRGGPR
jgi:hypothetical protein